MIWICTQLNATLVFYSDPQSYSPNVFGFGRVLFEDERVKLFQILKSRDDRHEGVESFALTHTKRFLELVRPVNYVGTNTLKQVSTGLVKWGSNNNRPVFTWSSCLVVKWYNFMMLFKMSKFRIVGQFHKPKSGNWRFAIWIAVWQADRSMNRQMLMI